MAWKLNDWELEAFQHLRLPGNMAPGKTVNLTLTLPKTFQSSKDPRVVQREIREWSQLIDETDAIKIAPSKILFTNVGDDVAFISPDTGQTEYKPFIGKVVDVQEKIAAFDPNLFKYRLRLELAGQASGVEQGFREGNGAVMTNDFGF